MKLSTKLQNHSDIQSVLQTKEDSKEVMHRTEGKNQALVGAIPYCGEYPDPRFEDKFRSANQMNGISKADDIKWPPVNL